MCCTMSVLKIKNVTMQFGGVTAVNNLNIEVQEGRIEALIGPNGAGKTTAFNVITGVYSPTKGNVSNEWLTGLIARISFNKKSIGLELLPVKMSNDFRKVDLIKSNNSIEVLKHVGEISAIINNENMLFNKWLGNDKTENSNIIRLLKSNSKLEYRLRKYLLPLFITKMTRYRRKTLLNILRCDSLRNRVIRILEYS